MWWQALQPALRLIEGSCERSAIFAVDRLLQRGERAADMLLDEYRRRAFC